jgi:hypothetical protein
MTVYVKNQLNLMLKNLNNVMSACDEDEKILLSKLENNRSARAQHFIDGQLIVKLLQAIDILEDINKNKPV